MTSVITFRSVRFTYDGEVNVLDGFDLTIEQGEYVCIQGGNGSGKSTVARLMNGLLLPDEGEVLVFGESTGDPECLMNIRSNVGMVFQNPDDQLVASIVENEVAFGPENLGLPSEEIRRRVSSALDIVGLAGFEKRRVDELSGGEKQRVAIAGALALEPRVLVLDEATAMIDPMGRAGLLRVVKRLNAQGMTIVVVTHDAREAQAAKRRIVLGQRDGGSVERPMRDAEAVSFSTSVGSCCATSSRKAYAGNSAAGAEGRQGNRLPLLSFDCVSYSYEKASRRRRSYRYREHPKASTPRWGGDPLASWALSDISFSVNRGEVFGIAGHTGSGKSTLIQLMGGLRQPTEGNVLLGQENLSDKNVARNACARIGISFQYPEYQLFAPSVREDIAFGPRNLGLSEVDVEQRVAETLRVVGLPEELAERSPFELSGGQQRRVALAGVLAMHPEILVLDEPAAGLDAHGKSVLYSLVARMRQAGRTVVIVSHDMDDLAQLCDRVLVLNQGRLFLLGTPDEVFRDCDVLQSVGLDVPCGLAREESR